MTSRVAPRMRHRIYETEYLGGSVTNQNTGTISGFNAIYGYRAITVVNAGTIAGNATYFTLALGSANVVGAGVDLNLGGSVTNQNTGVLSGFNGIFGGSVGHTGVADATVVNAGSIAGNATYGAGVRLRGGGSVTNQNTGTISGLRGIYGEINAMTVVNAGSIGGGARPSLKAHTAQEFTLLRAAALSTKSPP